MEQLDLEKELARLMALSNLNIDFLEPKRGLDNLVDIAAKVAGTEISMINLIDNFTQWSISAVGLAKGQKPKENSVCQYTLAYSAGECFEIMDLREDDRFKHQDYVTGPDQLKYYLGVPLTMGDGHCVGSLCVMDSTIKPLSNDQKELLTMIAKQVVDRLMVNKLIIDLKVKLKQSQLTNHKLAHDVRGPISGLVGLAEILHDQGASTSQEEIQEYTKLMCEGGNSVLELVSGILSQDQKNTGSQLGHEDEITLRELSEKITRLFIPQARLKNIDLITQLLTPESEVHFIKHIPLQILGNLVSNAIKFTPENGKVTVHLALMEKGPKPILWAKVIDSGVGMSPSKVQEIRTLTAQSEQGTKGEAGFGLGLKLVKSQLEKLNGEMTIDSVPGVGTEFVVSMEVV